MWRDSFTGDIIENLQGKNDVIDNIMFFFSRIGKAGFIFWLLAFALLVYYLFFGKDRRKAILSFLFFVVLGISFVMTDFILKPLIKADRPFVAYPQVIPFMAAHDYPIPDGYSFPSGHTVAAFMALTYLALIEKRSIYATIPLAIMIGFSRVFVGAHYLIDVFGGVVIGSIIGLLCYYLFDFILMKLVKEKAHENG